MKRFLNLLLIVLLTNFSGLVAQEDVEIDELLDISFEQLMHVKVKSASGVEEELVDAPSTMIVLTSEEITKRGYSNLAEILQDLPGFDIALSNGAFYMNAYQRGYRTPVTQRTLLLIDGKVDNHLWTHEAVISRQYAINIIKRIEVLYGPTSAIYGPNAFLGVINIITKDGSDIREGKNKTIVSTHAGSFNTVSTDLLTEGNIKGVKYSIGAQFFQSDEADLSGRWGFVNNDLLSNKDIWGPILNIENNNKMMDSYYDPSDDYSMMAQLSYKGLKLGGFAWRTNEGYGVQYPADRAQVNSSWNKTSKQLFLEYESDKNERLRYKVLLLHHDNGQFGDFAEATPDWNPGMEQYSYISFTNWNSVSSSWLLRQNMEYDINKKVLLSAGAKYERKKLTKAYDAPGYWGAFSSSVPNNITGPYGYGFSIGHSTDSLYFIAPTPNPDMPLVNLAYTNDIGGYIQFIFRLKKFNFHTGIRYDNNSIYGGSVNPRISAIYKFSKKGAVKLIYAEAFQEPPPVQLWGGWSGRQANPDLKPEKARNIELVGMLQTGKLFHDASIFTAFYDNVIKEEAENAGKRTIYGLDYRIRMRFKNFISKSKSIDAYLYYNYVVARSTITYDPESAKWENLSSETGDIAPHKLQFGIYFPIRKHFSLFLNSNYISSKTLYSRNPLRSQGEKLDSYFVSNIYLKYQLGFFTAGIKVYNVFDNQYFHSGIESASAGNDFNQRSAGWHNSLLPEPGRSFLLNLTFNIK